MITNIQLQELLTPYIDRKGHIYVWGRNGFYYNDFKVIEDEDYDGGFDTIFWFKTIHLNTDTPYRSKFKIKEFINKLKEFPDNIPITRIDETGHSVFLKGKLKIRLGEFYLF